MQGIYSKGTDCMIEINVMSLENRPWSIKMERGMIRDWGFRARLVQHATLVLSIRIIIRGYRTLCGYSLRIPLAFSYLGSGGIFLALSHHGGTLQEM